MKPEVIIPEIIDTEKIRQSASQQVVGADITSLLTVDQIRPGNSISRFDDSPGSSRWFLRLDIVHRTLGRQLEASWNPGA